MYKCKSYIFNTISRETLRCCRNTITILVDEPRG